jgi:hypothetical protein
MSTAKGFRFGLEAELLLVDGETFEPLWYQDLKFSELYAILESVPQDDVPPDGLKVEPPHRRAMPFVVEGYHVTDAEFRPYDIRPKGLEIRTPVSSSIDACIGWFATLYDRLQEALARHGYAAVAFSFHPREHHFEGPQNRRRYDFWQWAMEAMLTYGPDVNVGLPEGMYEAMDTTALDERVNYYAAALASFTLASPIHRGAPWVERGRVGKSIRTHMRSVVAPAIELHPGERGRLELKVFEMAKDLDDYRAMFLLWLELLLDGDLPGRADGPSRIYDLGAVARDGFAAETVRERGAVLLERAPGVLARHGFDPAPLEVFRRRLETGRHPADDILERFEAGNRSIPELLRSLLLQTGDKPLLRPL